MPREKAYPGIVSLRGHHFHGEFIGEGSVVVDLGAHRGEFSFQVHTVFGCTCHAVEAVPYLFDSIAQTDRIRKYHYAITGENRMVDVYLSPNSEAHSIVPPRDRTAGETITVEGVTLDAFVKRHALDRIDLLKVDIEGAEYDLFKTVSDSLLAQVGQITVEFHALQGKNGEVERVRSISGRLKRLGFFCVPFSIKDRTDILFLNRSTLGLSLLQCCSFRPGYQGASGEAASSYGASSWRVGAG